MTFLTILFSLLPGFAWLFFYLKEDLHPEPKKLIISTFLMGMAFSFFALALQIIIRPFLGGWGFAEYAFFSLFILAITEELMKFSAAYFNVHADPAFDEPVDAMIYMVIASLGFATVENIAAVHGNQSPGALLSDVLQITSLRFVGATLLHTLTSALVGYFWAVSIREFGQKRFIVYGLVLASALHAAFNYLILSYGNIAYSLLLLGIVGFFVLGDFERLKEKSL
ncbi:MAG: PrsW family glutamic-type intramembrane protease [Patescibacteria group bacterium]